MSIKLILMLISSFVLGIGSTVIANNVFINNNNPTVISEPVVCEKQTTEETFRRTRPTRGPSVEF